MIKATAKPIIISLGGSLIVPKQQVNAVYLKKFITFINQLANNQQRFIIFTGGGVTARHYQQAARAITKKLPATAQDWIGIKASLLNAELLKQLLGKLANDIIITDPRVKLRWPKPIWIGSGWKPGRSTDYDAVRLAVENNITQVINLSNIDYVYNKNPKQFPDAKPIKTMTWSEARKLLGNTWNPGLNVPFDPIAAKLAQQHNITVSIMNGENLKNVAAAVNGKNFKGTVIQL
ncbi:MAG: UMP kinase [Patescibacteria group bacterium]|jgi:uridylate kinase